MLPQVSAAHTGRDERAFHPLSRRGVATTGKAGKTVTTPRAVSAAAAASLTCPTHPKTDETPLLRPLPRDYRCGHARDTGKVTVPLPRHATAGNTWGQPLSTVGSQPLVDSTRDPLRGSAQAPCATCPALQSRSSLRPRRATAHVRRRRPPTARGGTTYLCDKRTAAPLTPQQADEQRHAGTDSPYRKLLRIPSVTRRAADDGGRDGPKPQAPWQLRAPGGDPRTKGGRAVPQPKPPGSSRG